MPDEVGIAVESGDRRSGIGRRPASGQGHRIGERLLPSPGIGSDTEHNVEHGESNAGDRRHRKAHAGGAQAIASAVSRPVAAASRYVTMTRILPSFVGRSSRPSQGDVNAAKPHSLRVLSVSERRSTPVGPGDSGVGDPVPRTV